ncbi:MAG TPA: methyltransferase domain-containing protein [Alicycliphilus sp.]|jgi:SAM-dependent methyltransferase|uniref:Methyltransferase domain-containing protein n=1 Tax=Diaphorobacter limosus TaxID=3036128 RepID=A0ABZ0J5H2_9BURK|nr:methyltransferase domain-containing protein [Diaphorobacter sp. Y-1]MBP6753604.1 methyltransferase domain-containing protein [Alicycliphilus sp.]MCA0439722.1 methyltransferase domain-containing protein [Pseudomonadota bacterium]MBP7326050.1 methyltransferase domain-containing protein [Alicycliphilus sp.]MBP7329776.1 methyltransferase domain-containing protein [Alicycliphilus sp.]MBP8780231.1 methyltransferase domain-containing protein [Alicycliphilus sp.]
MSGENYKLHHWFGTPPGRYLLAWEQERYDELVADIFGYHALQLGMPGLQALRANRMPHRWLALGADEAQGVPPAEGAADQGVPPALLAEAVALPFAEASLDLVALPHTLELSVDPHAALREVYRVLVPEGRTVISGLNPWSLWGLRQGRARLYQRLGGGGQPYLPDVGEFISPGRLRDWLRLLGFELETISFGCYRPAATKERWLQRHAWMESLGARWWPILGAGYVIVAAKRVPGMRLLEPSWRKAPRTAGAQVQVARRH